MHRLIALLCLQVTSLVFASPVELDLLMPDVSPKAKDTYLCKKFKLDQNQPIYINQFEANSTKEIAHHILLFGCDEVGNEDVWNCGEMNSGNQNDNYKLGPVCTGRKQSIIFAWALDAPKLVLPNDVAFKLGGDSDKKYLVMQVHYANVDKFINGGTDNSGLKLLGQTEPVENSAGVYLVSTGGYISPGKVENFEAACEMNENFVMHPFAYRTHAHKLGLVNSGYVVKKQGHDWTEIGRRSPQLPQMFFPVSNKVEINKGDVIVGRCTMKNFVDRTVHIGSTGDDEMCNFYIMYYVKGDKILSNNNCFSYGPPYWHLDRFRDSKGHGLDMDRMPKDASEVPADQVEQLKNGGGHGAHQNKHMDHSMKEEDMSRKEDNQYDIDESMEELREILLSNKIKNQLQASILNSLLDEYETKLGSMNEPKLDEDSDDIVMDLENLENEYYLRKLLGSR